MPSAELSICKYRTQSYDKIEWGLHKIWRTKFQMSRRKHKILLNKSAQCGAGCTPMLSRSSCSCRANMARGVGVASVDF
jgi:hypothetical protein